MQIVIMPDSAWGIIYDTSLEIQKSLVYNVYFV